PHEAGDGGGRHGVELAPSEMRSLDALYPAPGDTASTSSQARMFQLLTRPLRTNGSPETNSSAASRVVKTPIEPSSRGLANVPIIRRVPRAWKSSYRARWAGKWSRALETTSGADW